MKKLLALVLALVMTLGLATVGSNAAFTDADKIQYSEAVNVMSAIGVLAGMEDGSFQPTGTLTREQGAKIISYMLMGGKENGDTLSASSAPFADVAADRWSAGAIAFCKSSGILDGVGDNKFDPTGSLTGYAFAKMLLTALGYDADRAGLTGGDWQLNVAKLVNKIDLANGLGSVNFNAPLTRDAAAKLSYNTLTKDMVEYVGGMNVVAGDVSVSEDVPATRVANIAYGYDAPAPADGFMQFCENYFSTLKLETKNDEYGAQTNYWFIGKSRTDNTYANSKAITKDVTGDGVLATYTTDVDKITQGDLYKLIEATSAGTLNVTENGSANGTVAYAKGNTTKVFDGKYEGATIQIVDTDGDGDHTDAEVVVKYPFLAKVTKVTDATKTKDRYITMEVYNKATAVGNVTYETEEFAKNDFVLVYFTKNGANAADIATMNGLTTSGQLEAREIESVVKAETVNGKVSLLTGTNGATVATLTVNGTKYELAVDTIANMSGTAGTKTKAFAYSFSNEYDLYLANGFVIGTKGVESNVAETMDDVVYVTDAAYATTEYGKSIKWAEYVKLDGTVDHVRNDGDADGTTDVNDTAGAALAAGFYTISKIDGKDNYKFTKLVTTAPVYNTAPYVAVDTLNGAVNLKADTKSVAVNTNTKAYITDSTVLLFVTGTGADIKTSAVVGPIRQAIANASKVVVSQDKSNNFIVNAILIGAKQVNMSGEKVFVTNTNRGTTKIEGTTRTLYRMYSLEDGSYTDVPASAAPTTGFNTYSVDSDGVYTFTAVGAGAANGDGQYNLTAAATLYNDRLLTEGPMTDLPADNAVIHNIVTDGETDTIKDIADSATVVAYALVDDEKVVCIFVTTD